MAKTKKQKSRFRQKITNKYRMVVLNEETFEERFSIKLSRLNIFVLSGLFSIILVVLTTFFIAYTPIKEYIPGYSSTALKKSASKLVFEADSLKNRLQVLENYTKALLPVLTGKVAAADVNFDLIKNNDNPANFDLRKLDATKEDSLYREKIDSKDRFALFDQASSKTSTVFFTPITGTITQKFDAASRHYAIDVVAKTGTPIKVIGDGTVIFSEWTTETGYVIIVDHANGFISVYKHNGVLLKEQGDIVKSGEVIASVGSTGELTTGPHLHFELWYDGYPVNPANYIDFQ